MNTIILNGSPKGNSKKCNSQIFAEEFIKNMKKPCEIKCIAQNDPKELAQYVTDFDALIIILPLYVHAMPGVVMKFIQELKPASSKTKYLGFIVQAGFVETAQHKFVVPYFEDLARQLNYTYLGTVSKGESAVVYMYPKMFTKVFRLLNDLGMAYEETHTFDREIVQKLAEPYELSKFQLWLFWVVKKLGLGSIFWHKMLKQHNAMDKRLDRPFSTEGIANN